jgi:hypothetical protein
MTQPVPEYPTNVQASNPYEGIDRGLFMIQGPVPKFARVHSARWVTHGPNAGIGRLEYQIMVFNAMPTTNAQYMGGVLAKAPDGSEWFDCLTRGSLLPPIMVEYWARHSYQGYYTNHEVTDAGLLSDLEKNTNIEQAQALTVTMGRPLELDSIEFIVTYNQTAGMPLTRSSAALTIGYGPTTNKQEITLTDFNQQFFDPVQYALAHLKSLRT